MCLQTDESKWFLLNYSFPRLRVSGEVNAELLQHNGCLHRLWEGRQTERGAVPPMTARGCLSESVQAAAETPSSRWGPLWGPSCMDLLSMSLLLSVWWWDSLRVVMYLCSCFNFSDQFKGCVDHADFIAERATLTLTLLSVYRWLPWACLPGVIFHKCWPISSYSTSHNKVTHFSVWR